MLDRKLSKTEKEKLEKSLLETVEENPYPEVRGKLTAKALMDYSDNPLIFAIKVSEVMPSIYSCHACAGFKHFYQEKEKSTRRYEFSLNLGRCVLIASNEGERIRSLVLGVLCHTARQIRDFLCNGSSTPI